MVFFNIVRKLCLTVAALGMLSPSLAMAQPAKPLPPTNPTRRMGFLLQVYDPGKLLASDFVVHLVGTQGTKRVLRPEDKGSRISMDQTAGDHIYSAPVPGFPDPGVDISIKSGTRSWAIKVKLDPKDVRAMVFLKLSGDRVAQTARVIIQPGAPGQTPSPPGPGARQKTTGDRSGFLLQIYDPKGFLKKPPRVSLRGSLGAEREVTARDDGVITHSDVAKGDGVFSAPVTFFPDSVVNITIRSTRRTWTIKVTKKPQALVFLQLMPGGKIKEVPREVVGRPLPPNQKGLDGKQAEANAVIPTVTRSPRPKNEGSARLSSGYVMWALFFVTLGLGLAITLALTGRRPRGASRLEVTAADPIAPVQLEAGDVAAALEGPLAGHRVVLLGEPPDGDSQVVRCLEQTPLPEELVTSVERLAVSFGPPVALLVTDPERVDRAGPSDPVISLSKRVAQRFPLWVVDGPEEWERWESTGKPDPDSQTEPDSDPEPDSKTEPDSDPEPDSKAEPEAGGGSINPRDGA